MSGVLPSSAPDRPLFFFLKSVFGFDTFRSHQEDVCQKILEGRDVLLVMPTGAGKSLCYQLPGLARGGTTLVISPLLALIEDQVEKLKRMGLTAERIHSGRRREESRQACIAYLRGELKFLFIAPERLSIPGFVEMLKKRAPTLIAIDEAHCISQWGHDFRPDYRLLGDRIGELRPAPIVALTATATAVVQDDIAAQLGLQNPVRSIHGFRRKNIAIHVIELSSSERFAATHKILKQKHRLPAIVYTSTRKTAETIFKELSKDFKTGIYHAGMPTEEREKNQELFLDSKLDVIVATVAFGMGIDKADIRTVIHTALPGSIEGYYQEIGRAGRDGKPSQAVLLQSFADQRMHDFFFQRDYPEPAILKKIFKTLSTQKQDKATVKKTVSLSPNPIDDGLFETALGKLIIHRGATESLDGFAEYLSSGSSAWEQTYPAQRQHREQQLSQMQRFTQAKNCRMLALVQHFGDQNDSSEPCGQCDICMPSGVPQVQVARGLTPKEKQLVAQILAILAGYGDRAAGRIYEELTQTTKVSRSDFETLLKLLARVEWIAMSNTTFQLDGKAVTYRKVSATKVGQTVTAEHLERLQTHAKSQMNLKKPRSPKKPGRRSSASRGASR